MKVINFHGAPGCGKSTAAAELFFYMKTKDHAVELIVERSKELIAENNLFELSDEISIFAEKNKRIQRFTSSVEYVITDSALFNSAFYGCSIIGFSSFLCNYIPNKYENLYIFLDPIYEYKKENRMNNQTDAINASNEIEKYIRKSEDENKILHQSKFNVELSYKWITNER
jgi:hypothetical protein